MNKKRIFYYDVLRAIAIVGVVFCHSSVAFILMGVDNPTFYISAFFDCFRDFSIPIFVMLSGALLINKSDSLTNFFKKRFSRIFIPFVFWVIIYIIYSSIYIDQSFSISTAIDIFLGTRNTFGVIFWFIWMIIIVYCGIFIINKIIEFGNMKRDNFANVFIALLTILSIFYILISQFGLFNPYCSRLTYFFSFMSYAVIGYYIANSDLLGNMIGDEKMIAITFIISFGLYFYYIFDFVVPQSILASNFVYLGYFNVLILAISANIFLLFKYLSKREHFKRLENNDVGRALTLLSKYSFGIYLCHYLIIHILKVSIFKLNHNPNPLIWIPILVISTLAISLLILWVMNKIPYLDKFSAKS